MRGVAEQGDPAEAPARQGVAVGHRVLDDRRGAFGEHPEIDPRQVPGRQCGAGLRGGDATARASRGRGGRAVPHLQHPVHEGVGGGGRAVLDRIGDELRAGGAPGHHDRPAVEDPRVRCDPAPHVDAVPVRRSLVRVQPAADRGVETVGADQDVGGVDHGPSARPVQEPGADAVRVLLEPLEQQAGTDRVRSQPLADRRQEQQLQAAAVHGVLRPAVPGGASQRFLPDRGARPVPVAQPVRGQCDGGESVLQAEFGEFPDGVRQQVDPDADRLDLPRRLVHPGREAGGVQAQGTGQSGDAAADDGHSHLSALALRRSRGSGRYPGYQHRRPRSPGPIGVGDGSRHGR